MRRREFLTALGGAACVGCSLTSRAHAGLPRREVDYYDQLANNQIQCHVCPIHCVLSEGDTCFCRTRTNVGGRLFTTAYDNPCILRIDPIEKMPLHHFHPGSKTLTLGLGGCNLRCLYCQNWEQSQSKPHQLKTFALDAGQVVDAAKRKGLSTIAFSYTEPVAFLEWARDVAEAAKRAGLKVVVATAASVNVEPLLDFAQYVDAFAVSLKGFDDDFYHQALGARLQPVLKAIKAIKEQTS